MSYKITVQYLIWNVTGHASPKRRRCRKPDLAVQPGTEICENHELFAFQLTVSSPPSQPTVQDAVIGGVSPPRAPSRPVSLFDTRHRYVAVLP